MKSVRDELAEALTETLQWDHPSPATRYQREDANKALARHAAEPDDRPRLLALLKEARGIEYEPYEVEFEEAIHACSDIETP